MRAAVLGAGSWGTAIAILLARNGAEVSLWGRQDEDIDILRTRRENLRYLPGFLLPEEIQILSDADSIGDTDLWIIAVPSHAVRAVSEILPSGQISVAIASKGLESSTCSLLGDVVLQIRPEAEVAAISGPNLALEIVRGIPTAAVAASKNEALADRVRNAFMCKTYRVYTSSDLIGVEVAGALKNVLAIAAGMSDGLGFGDNTKGALLARGLYEMTSLGVAMGGQMHTFMGIAGVGDLFATAASPLSRNYRVGRLIGEGAKLDAALEAVGQVAEGVDTTEAAVTLGRRLGVSTPIFEAVEAVLRGRLSPLDGVSLLMERVPKKEGPEGLSRQI